MEVAVQGRQEMIRFTCSHCEAPLTVEGSLAGITGPCPSCGQSITAPGLKPKESPKETLPVASVRKEPKPEVAPGPKLVPGDIPKTLGSSPEKTQVKKKVSRPASNPKAFESQRERAEVVAVVKAMVLGVVVLAVILTAVWWINSQAG